MRNKNMKKLAFDLMNALNGAAAGAGLGSAFAGIGAIPGAVGGGLLGGFLGGGGTAAKKPAPKLSQQPLRPVPPPRPYLSGMTHYASLDTERRDAIDWGINLFCKHAGLDAEDTLALHALIKSADGEIDNRFAQLNVRKPTGFNPYGTGGYTTTGTNKVINTNLPGTPLQNQFDQGAAEDGAGTPGGNAFAVGQGFKTYLKYLNPLNIPSNISNMASQFGQDYAAGQDAFEKQKRETAIDDAVKNKTLGPGFLNERRRTDLAKVNDQNAALSGQRDAYNKEVGRADLMQRRDQASVNLNARNMSPAQVKYTAGGGNSQLGQNVLNDVRGTPGAVPPPPSASAPPTAPTPPPAAPPPPAPAPGPQQATMPSTPAPAMPAPPKLPTPGVPNEV